METKTDTKYTIVLIHPSGDALVKSKRGQEFWVKHGTFVINDDGTCTLKLRIDTR